MDITLEKKPKNPVIIEGFPGFGLIGTIGTEFLIEHLDCEKIGKIMIEGMPPVIAIHEGKLIEPIGIYYAKKYNIVVLHIISAINGMEWKIAEAVDKIANDLKAKEIVSMEGVGNNNIESDTEKIFYYSNTKHKDEEFAKLKVEKLKEGIVMGVTGAILMNIKNVPVTCVFSETHSALPDSSAAAKIIGVIDKYLKLNVDPRPLLDQAKKFEEKLQSILSKSKEAEELQDKKRLNYVG